MVNSWQDCQDGCPGTGNNYFQFWFYMFLLFNCLAYECNEGFLFNVDGVCINGTSATSLLTQLKTGPLKAILDSVPSETRQKVAPFCEGDQTLQKSCKCTDGPVTKGLDGNPKGGCIPPLV